MLEQMSLAGDNLRTSRHAETNHGNYSGVLALTGPDPENRFSLALTRNTWNGLVSKGFRPIPEVGETTLLISFQESGLSASPIFLRVSVLTELRDVPVSGGLKLSRKNWGMPFVLRE